MQILFAVVLFVVRAVLASSTIVLFRNSDCSTAGLIASYYANVGECHSADAGTLSISPAARPVCASGIPYIFASDLANCATTSTILGFYEYPNTIDDCYFFTTPINISSYGYFCSDSGHNPNIVTVLTSAGTLAPSTSVTTTPHLASLAFAIACNLALTAVSQTSPSLPGTSSLLSTNASQTTSRSSTSAAVSTSAASQDSTTATSGSGGISLSDRVALGVGIGIGLPSLIATIVGIIVTARRNRRNT